MAGHFKEKFEVLFEELEGENVKTSLSGEYNFVFTKFSILMSILSNSFIFQNLFIVDVFCCFLAPVPISQKDTRSSV